MTKEFQNLIKDSNIQTQEVQHKYQYNHAQIQFNKFSENQRKKPNILKAFREKESISFNRTRFQATLAKAKKRKKNHRTTSLNCLNK